MSWSDDKELSSGADAIGWNSLKKKKKKIVYINLGLWKISLKIFNPIIDKYVLNNYNYSNKKKK